MAKDDKGIGKMFGTMEENVRKGIVRGLEYIDKELSAGREVIFKKKDTIDLMRGNPLYDIVDLPDGSIKVLKINQEARDIFEGKAVPPSPARPLNPRFYTPEEAASVLGVSLDEIKKYVQSGDLQELDDKGQVLFRKSAVERIQMDRLGPEGNAPPARASKPKKSFEEVTAGINAAAGQPKQTPASRPVDREPSPFLLEIQTALEESRAARLANREGQGLNPDVTIEDRERAAEMRDPVISESEGVSNPRRMRRMPKTVVVGGRAIELPEDYAQRKKFRQYRHQEVERSRDELAAAAAARARRRAQDQRTADQMRGTLGRAGRRAGLAVGGAVKGLPKIPLPGARNPLVRFGLRYGKNIGGMRGGLAGLGALAGGALAGKLIQSRMENSEIEQQRQEDLRRSARQDMLNLLGRKEHKQALQMSIGDNLAQLQQKAPDLYMSVAAGRRLPQGAVVIGGVPRQDLLQQLGMSMSNGDFNQ